MKGVEVLHKNYLLVWDANGERGHEKIKKIRCLKDNNKKKKLLSLKRIWHLEWFGNQGSESWQHSQLLVNFDGKTYGDRTAWA